MITLIVSNNSGMGVSELVHPGDSQNSDSAWKEDSKVLLFGKCLLLVIGSIFDVATAIIQIIGVCFYYFRKKRECRGHKMLYIAFGSLIAPILTLIFIISKCICGDLSKKIDSLTLYRT